MINLNWTRVIESWKDGEVYARISNMKSGSNFNIDLVCSRHSKGKEA